MRSIPWMTDGSVNFINNRINQFRKASGRFPTVLEFGAGASTMYFAYHSSRLVTFEHDDQWHRKVRAHMEIDNIKHATVHHFGRPYSERVAETIGSTKFEIISIDGRDRLACLVKVLELDALAENGFIVIDNTERITGEDKRYAPMVDALDAHGFRHVHFEQIGTDRAGWIPTHRWLTTVAWRKNGIQFTSQGYIL